MTKDSAAIRVLIVSADSDAIGLLSDVIMQMGIHLEICSDRKSAARHLCSSKFEGIMVDLQLGEDGLELLKSLADFTSNKGAVSCALLSETHEKATAFQAGANFVLERPLDKDTTLRTIRAAYPMMVRERRRYFRCPVQTTTFVSSKSHPEFQATSVNLSEAGMAILSPVELKVGQRLHIRLRMPGKQEFVDLTAEVCWTDPTGRAGVQFMEISRTVAESLASWLLQRLEEMMPKHHEPSLPVNPLGRLAKATRAN